MDYKRLMSGKEDPLLLLTPLLSTANVHVVAKVAGKIPCQVYCDTVTNKQVGVLC